VFIALTKVWTFEQRKSFASWLLPHEEKERYSGWLSPIPLWQELLLPTLEEWAEVLPAESLPYRWLGIRGDTDYLRRALEIDPEESLTREHLVRRIRMELLLATEDMDYLSVYHGDVMRGVDLVGEALSIIDKSAKSEQNEILKAEFKRFKTLLAEFLLFQKSGRTVFWTWSW
jgi:hypothetical protein